MPGEFPLWQVDPYNTRACAHTAAQAAACSAGFLAAAVARGPRPAVETYLEARRLGDSRVVST
ncbi:hypothetical protein Pd630_LPD07955 [Rhodococcus opacus PD630]|nr:hypothetical protein Pd630_LPD07955 [Rhodococcus opacus PD630]